MDLRSVLNNSDTGDRDRERERERATSKHPPTPQQQPQHHQQSPASYPYREYGRPPPQVHQSPGKPPHQEYPHALQQPPAGSHQPQSPYQQPAHYPVRPAPPSLQPTNSFHDPRSPGGSIPVPSPTAYRPNATPSTAPAGATGGYPFPPQEITSPSMRHQYPPAAYQPHQPQRQETYSHGSGPYAQQPSHVSLASPVAASSATHPYPPQRSQSTHSTPTPTSAHSQQQYGPPLVHGSPVATAHPPPAEYNRQPSQPPTPHGQPLSAQRQPGGHAAYAQPQHQPSSPYQQRVSSIPGALVVQTQSSPPPPQPQPPLQPQHPPVPRMPTAENHQQPLLHHDRENSLSVSPKTRVPSLPSNADRNSISIDRDHKQPHAVEPMAIDSDRAVTPAKRKLQDRDLSPRELEHKEPRPPPGEVNGDHIPTQNDASVVKVEPPVLTRKTRCRRSEPPIWAQSIRSLGKQLPKHANFVLQKRVHSHLNGGRPDGPPDSGNQTPEKPKARTSQPPAPPAEPTPQDILGPWEASITGVRPYEEVSRLIADFLFVHVVNSEDMQEVASRGIKFEVEAKLGTLIDKDTNQRVNRAIESEAVLQDTGRTAFRSSMTEVSLGSVTVPNS